VPEALQLQSLANGAGWYLLRSCALYAEPDKPVGRLLMTFSRQQQLEQSLVGSLIVRDDSGAYSAQYRTLLRDFYLKF
jgi:tRNA1Val (adenine37-N6)-methyltransferase